MNTCMPELTTLQEDLSGLVTFLEGGTHISCVKSCILAQWEEKPSNATCKTLFSVVQRNELAYHHGPVFASLRESHFLSGC